MQKKFLVKEEALDGLVSIGLRRNAAEVSIDQSRELFSSGGFLDSQTTDTQFFGFSQSSNTQILSTEHNDGSPIHKRFKKSVTPDDNTLIPFHIVPIKTEGHLSPLPPPLKFEASNGSLVINKIKTSPSPEIALAPEQKVTMKTKVQETRNPVSCFTLPTPLMQSVRQPTVNSSPPRFQTNIDSHNSLPSDAEELDDEDDEYLEARMDSLVQELGRARMRVETLEKELITIVSVRYARMKTLLASNSSTERKERSCSPPVQETQTWNDHGHLSEDPYYPSIESQIYRTITAGYEGRKANPEKWLK